MRHRTLTAALLIPILTLTLARVAQDFLDQQRHE